MGERVLFTPGNPISLGLTLNTLTTTDTSSSNTAEASQGTYIDKGSKEDVKRQQGEGVGVTFLGSMLFTRCTSGARVVSRGKVQEVAGIQFQGYGAHCDAYPVDYITVAAALGTSEREVDEFLARLGTCMKECQEKQQK